MSVEIVESCSARIRKALSARNMTQTELCEKAKISKSTLSEYLKGLYEPKQDKIFILSQALDVDPVWLMGYDVQMEKSLNPFDDTENPYELEVRDVFDTLDLDSQIYVASWIKAFAKNPVKMKSATSELQLTDGEKMMIDIFRLIPEDQQKVFLEMGRVYANSLKKD